MTHGTGRYWGNIPGAKRRGKERHWGNIPGAECRGAGSQWDRTSLSRTSWGRTSLGQYPWGRRSVGQEVLTSGAGSKESNLGVSINFCLGWQSHLKNKHWNSNHPDTGKKAIVEQIVLGQEVGNRI